jgi:hypothetical protein
VRKNNSEPAFRLSEQSSVSRLTKLNDFQFVCGGLDQVQTKMMHWDMSKVKTVAISSVRSNRYALLLQQLCFVMMNNTNNSVERIKNIFEQMYENYVNETKLLNSEANSNYI